MESQSRAEKPEFAVSRLTGEFVDAAAEATYRAATHPTFAAHNRTVLLITAVVVVAFTAMDFSRLGFGEPIYALAGARLAFLATALAAIAVLSQSTRIALADYTILSSLATLSVSVTLAVASRPDDLMVNAIAGSTMVMFFYFLVFVRTAHAVFVSLFQFVLFVTVMSVFTDADARKLQMLVTLLVTFNVIGWMTLNRMHRTDRRRYASSVAEERARHRLEREMAEHAEAAAAARASEERYELAMRGAGEALWEWGAAPARSYLSAHACSILGIVDGEATTFDEWRARIHPEDNTEFLNQIRRHLRGETELYQHEYRVRHEDGHYCWVRDRGVALRDENGRAYRMAGSIRDVTVQRKTETDLRLARERAEFANRSKSEFLANMSHELRTPLNAIIGFSELMQKELLGPLGDPRYDEYVNDINDSGKHLLSVINDILDLSKIEAGKLELDEAVFSLSSVADSCLRLVNVRARQNEVRLDNRVADVPLLLGDPRLVKQILINLLSNAVKFTPEGGTVTMSANLTPAGDLAISVADTGIGINERDIDRVLCPFGQADSSMSRYHEGTGLGLPLSKSLTELHGGTLKLVSELGSGTTVSVTFPKNRVQYAEPCAAAQVQKAS